jgi:hypothetical protein
VSDFSKALFAFETLVAVCSSTRLKIPEDLHLYFVNVAVTETFLYLLHSLKANSRKLERDGD